jgi:Arc/MetJ-type ribon-helix-helix transcriptional regulator
MTRQISVRIDDDLIAFADQLVKDKKIKSRNAIVNDALRREKRRVDGERDAEIYRKYGEDPELVAMVQYCAHRPLDID